MKSYRNELNRRWSCLRFTLPAFIASTVMATGSWAAVLINLDATQLPEGPLSTWKNTGTLPGDFVSAGSTEPVVVKAKAGKGVQFSDTAHYYGPEVPPSLTGNASRTIEAWVFNPTPQGEETVFAWGRRGADNLNCSFGHGTDLSFGAVGHWGAADIGWENNIVFNEWTYIVYTYDGYYQTTTVYKDGVVANTETLSTPLDTAAVSTSGEPLHFRVARQNTAAGGVSGTGVGDIIIGKIRVHDVALDPETILANYNAEVDQFIERDSDGDGMPDWWEALHPFLNINDKSDADLDYDSDGLTNLAEWQHKTAPDNPDTDGDGVTDGAEVNRTVGGSPAPTDPTNPDTDNDGLSDGVETNTGVYKNQQDTGTDPLKPDTDEDGYADWQEVLHGSDPTKASSIPAPDRQALVLLDATKSQPGPLPVWPNTGVLPGNFAARDAADPPEIVTILGVNGVQFDGTEYYTGPSAPLWVTGNGAHTVEAWVYNPSLAEEETVFAWGRRGGGDGTNCSFNHGTNPSYGAVGHWGGPDLGWDGNIVAGQWTHIVYTWNPATMYQTVYKDGQPAASEYLSSPLSIWAVATDGKPLPFRVASQNEANGAATGTLRGSMTIAKIAVYDYSFDDATVLQHYNADLATFGLLDDDNDGMPTWYERMYSFLNPYDSSDAAKDQDADGLTNVQEYLNKTQPENPDSDDDGVNDGTEVNTLKTRPLVSDTDQDGLSDGQEIIAGTDPLNPDTDFDTYADGLEVARKSDPKSASSTPSFTERVAIIDVNASDLPLGPLVHWPNNGALGGRFKAGPRTPTVEVIRGIKAVTFDGTMYYSGPVTPTWMTGNSARTVEAWVYNPQIDGEETVFAWGRRGGPDGSNCSFNHGTDVTFGAVGHWGAADVGWAGKITAGQWSHIAYTYDPNTYFAIVYSAGQPANTNDIFTAIGAGLNTYAVNDAPEPDTTPLTFLIAAQHDSNGSVTETLRGSLSIARIRVYDQALSADEIANIYAAEVGKYTVIRIESITYNAATDALTITWTTSPGAKYDVLATSVLGTPFTPVATDLSTGTYTDHPSVAGKQRFYLIRLK